MKTIEHNRGLSLVETVVTIAIFVLIMAALVSSLIYFYRTNAFSVEQTSAITEARRGVETMVEELREATYAETGAFPIESIGKYDATVYSDVDHDDLVEKVRFFLDDNEFKRGVTTPDDKTLKYKNEPEEISTIAPHVRNEVDNTSIFTYFDKNGDEVEEFEEVDDVRFIRVNLIVNINPTRKPQDFTLRSSATLRNLR